MKLDVIYNEDCLGERGMRILPNKSIDMILCDLPYGITACKWDTVIPLEPMWEQLKRVIKLNGAIVLTASQPFTTMLITNNMKMFKYCWIWYKNAGSGFASVKKRPIKYHEDICVFYKKQPTYNPQRITRTSLSSLARYQTPVGKGNSPRSHGTLKNIGNVQYDVKTKSPETVLQIKCIPNNGGHRIHPTQKPVALMEYLIKTYTNEGEIVLDFAMGSGTTAVACKRLDRHYIGFEIDPEYCGIAKRRLSEVQLELV